MRFWDSSNEHSHVTGGIFLYELNNYQIFTTFPGLLWRPGDVAQLRAHIAKLCRALSEDLCRKVVTNARVRLQEVVRQNGGHIEHVLY